MSKTDWQYASTKDGYNHRPLKGAQQTSAHLGNRLEMGFQCLGRQLRDHPDVMALGTSHSWRQELFLVDYFASSYLCPSSPPSPVQTLNSGAVKSWT